MDTVQIILYAEVTAIIGMFSTILLIGLFPCSGNPKRDCSRNCADCKRDREVCRKRLKCPRERAETEEELVVSP